MKLRAGGSLVCVGVFVGPLAQSQAPSRVGPRLLRRQTDRIARVQSIDTCSGSVMMRDSGHDACVNT